MDLNPNNPNFAHKFRHASFPNAIKVKAVIKHDYDEWEEEFSVTSIEKAPEEIEEVMVYFNSTLRKGEFPRTFVRLVEENE